MPAVAICIPTRNRPRQLAAVIQDIVGQSHDMTISVHVSDDSPLAAQRDENRAIAESLGATWREGPRRGVCANRNNCLRDVALDSDYVLFLDDDCRLEPMALGALRNWYLTHSDEERLGVILAGRERSDAGGASPPYRMTFRGFYQAAAKSEVFSCKATVYPLAVFDKCCWNEHLYFGCEDADLAFQAVAAGFRIEEFPDLEVLDTAPWEGTLGADSEAWICAARLHVGLKRYLYYRRNLALAAAYLGYQLAVLARSAVRRKDMRWPFKVMSRVRWRGIPGPPLRSSGLRQSTDERNEEGRDRSGAA